MCVRKQERTRRFVSTCAVKRLQGIFESKTGRLFYLSARATSIRLMAWDEG
jgi:hypothetical protein